MDSETQGAAQGPSTTDPEAMAVRRLELELEKVRLQLECERIALRRVELEQSSRPPSVWEGSDRRGAITDGIAQCAKVLKAYRLPCDADVPIWFDEVEKLFTSFQVPAHSRVHLIMPALAERVRYLLRGLNDEECTDYETVKKAVLDELKLTPAKYLERFEKASKRKEETWAQFASRARTYLAYYLQSRNANTKEAMTELMVADRMKASLSSGALEYVLLREGEDWFKPVEVAKVLETFEQAKGKGRATKPAATASLPQRAKLAGPQRTNLRCHVCHIQGHLARDCPKASDKEPQGKPPTVQKQRVQKVAVVSEEPPPEQERVLSARVHVVAQNASSGRSKLDLIPIMCGDIATEAVLDTGSEITVVRKSMLPIDLQEPSRTVRLESAFGNTIRAKLATLPVGMHRPGAVIQPQRIDLVCAVTDELTNGVDCLLSKEDWELLRAQEKEEFGEENIPRAGVRSVEMVDNTEPDCGLSFEETTEQMPKLQENSFIQDVTGVPSQRELELAESVAELTGTECQSKHALVYNRRARTKEFNVGDQVLLFDTGWATKIAAIEGLVPPHTKKELRSLLGLCGHYRDYVSNYADVASPLTALTRRGVPNSIPWSEEAQCAFESLKLALCQAVAMNTPEPRQPYWLFTDAYEPGYVSEIHSSGRCTVNVWGAISKEGLGPLIRLSPSFTAEAYCDILDYHLLPYALDGPFKDGCYFFQQDLSPVHTARAVAKLLQERGVRVLDWPPKGADFNVMENVWGMMKESLSKLNLGGASADELWLAITREWKRLGERRDFVDALYESIPRRVQAALRVDGAFGRY
ncbi:uncharacterized protein [Dermacentor albipictus]|uniref:uncharacterized protein n=1 Tax=Dermacentor albipictus TaxID=60249 RepID=UPI0038FD3849